MDQDSTHRARREQDLFNEALELGSPAQRDAFLRGACGADVALREAVESLLLAHAQAGGFLPTRAAQAPPDEAQPRPLEEADGLFGRYKLLQKIGEGGCGIVYAAEQQEPVRRRVALKVIKLGMDTKSVIARFEAERQALALMDHPNIAKVLDAGATDTGRPYFVMELVRGIRITDYCDRNHLSTHARLELFIKVCQAIQHAHQKGIIHRDIKPSNILVTLHDGVPVPKVIDFGIAKATTDQRLTDRTLYTALEQFVGTPAYMSPEQAELSGLDIDTRSDVYSLGVLLYELLTGKTPFDSQALLSAGLDAMRQTIREREPERPSTRLGTMLGADLTTTAEHRQTDASALVGEIRGDLDWIVMRCLEKDRTRRYETANGLAMDLRRHLEGEPVLARPPSTGYLVRKFVRRNRLKVAAGVAVLAAVVIGGAASAWQATLAWRAAQRETAARQEAQAAGALAGKAEQRAIASLALAEKNATQAARLLYDADINLAQRALQSKHLGLARRYLARHVPEGGIGRKSLPESFSFGPEQAPSPLARSTHDLRGWEWRYLWQQSQSPAVRLCNLRRGVAGLSFARDGDRLVATMLGGERAELWSRRTGQRLQVLTTNGCGGAQNWQAAFSPVAPLLAVGLARGAVLVTNLDTHAHWTLQTGALLGDPRMMADKLAFSPDGRRLAVLGGHWWGSSDKGTLFIWETETFTLVSTAITSAPIGDGYAQGGVAWMPNSDWLWIGAKDSSIELRSASGGPPLEQAVADARRNYLAMAVSPSGDTLATACATDPVVRVWDLRNGKLAAPPRRLEGHTAFVSSLAYSPDGRGLVSASADQTIRWWDTSTWESVELLGHTEEVHALAFTPDGRALASGSRNGEVLLWHLEKLRPSPDHQRLPPAVTSAVIVPGSRHVLACMTNALLVLIETRSLAMTPVPLPFVPASARLWSPGVALASDGTNLLALVEVTAQGSRVQGQVTGAPSALAESCYSPENRVFAFPSATHAVTCVPLDDPGRHFEMSAGPGITNLTGLRFRGRQLLGYAEGAGILVWDLQARTLARRVVLPRVKPIPQPELPDLIAFDQARDAIQFRDPDQPETVRHEIPVPYSIWGQWAFSPDQRTLAYSIQDTGSILLIDLPTRTLQRSLQRHLMAVRGLGFSSDGRRLASGGGNDDLVKLWDVETGQELLTLSGDGQLTGTVQFSDDGNLILASGWHLWRAPSWEEIRLAEETSESRLTPPPSERADSSRDLAAPPRQEDKP